MSWSRPVSPFIPPRPGAAPAAPAVVPPHASALSPEEGSRVIPPNPYAGYPAQAEPPGWGPAPNPYAAYYPTQAPQRTPYRTDGMPPGPGYDPGTYFNRPSQFSATPASNPAPMTDDWGIPRDFGRPQSIRVDRDGFAEDYRGPRGAGGLEDWTAFRQAPIPNTFAEQVPPGTPWYAPPPAPPAMHTGYSAFQQPLPGAVPTPYGAQAAYLGASPYGPANPYAGAPTMGHRRPSHSRTRSTHNTPWMGGGYMPVTPGANTQPLPGGHVVERPDRTAGGVDTRWMTGRDYGPVLDPVLASIVNCKPKINPLLAAPPEDPSKCGFLEWNMLFPSSYVHRSNDREEMSWMDGRHSPATFPRVKTLRIISRQFTWFIDVKGRDPETGVTCGDVIDTLAKFFYQQAPQAEFEACSKPEQNRISAAYHNNRSRSRDVPGGTLGQGLRRCDFLGDRTMFGGIMADRDYVRQRLQLGRSQREFPCIFVLTCDVRLPQTVEELRTADARSRSRNRRQARVDSDSGSEAE